MSPEDGNNKKQRRKGGFLYNGMTGKAFNMDQKMRLLL